MNAAKCMAASMGRDGSTRSSRSRSPGAAADQDFVGYGSGGVRGGGIIAGRSDPASERCRLPQVGAGLHFDQFQGDAAGVFERVDLAHGDEGGFDFGDEIGLVAVGDARGAAHRHPVLGPVVVHLHRELGARETDSLTPHTRGGSELPHPIICTLALNDLLLTPKTAI